MKIIHKQTALILAIILLSAIFLAACESEVPRLASVPTYNPGPAFSTNFNDEDPRRQIKCSIIFEVIDEQAIVELEERNYKVRNSVLIVLSSLTMTEITTNRDLDDILHRITEKVNEDLQTTGDINLIIRAYFTDFAIV